jgi:SecD/SecF fusion protein
LGFSIVAIVIGLCAWAFSTLEFRLGIDLQGGTELVYEINVGELEYDVGGSNVAEVVKDLIYNRLDAFGLKEIGIAVVGGDRLVIQLPGADKQFVDEIKRQIEDTGTLEFTLVHDAADRQGRAGRLLDAISRYNQEEQQYVALLATMPTAKKPVWPEELRQLAEEHKTYKRERLEWERKYREAASAEERAALQQPKAPDFIALYEAERQQQEGSAVYRFVNKPGGLTLLRYGEIGEFRVSGRNLNAARNDRDEKGRPCIAFGFDAEGATQFSRLSGNNVGKQLAVVLDERLIQAPVIRSRIAERGEITGDFTHDEVTGVVNILRGGSLPAKPSMISESTIGAGFGQEAVRSGFMAVVIGAGAVLIFMVVYYMLGGMIANFALVFNVVLILAFVLIFRQTLTVPGIAGILLTIGMAVDANILIFERVREELAKGKSLPASLAAGYQRAFWVIFDSNLTTLITAAILFRFGSGPLKGFAVTLTAGLMASFFTAVFVTRVILSFLLNHKLISRFPMMRLLGVPRVPFQAYRRTFVGISLVLIAATWGICVIPRGSDNYGIDFTGGQKVTLSLAREIPSSELVGLIEGLTGSERALFADTQVQTLEATQRRGVSRKFSILTRSRDSASDAGGKAAGQGPENAGAEARAIARAPEEIEAVLRRALAAREKERGETLLLPEPLPHTDAGGAPIVNPRWVAAAPPGAAAAAEGMEGLEMELNLLDVDPTLSAATMQDLLGRHLERAYAEAVRAEAASADGFKGILVAELRELSKLALGKDGDSSGLVLSRFLVKTSGYHSPEGTVATLVPKHSDVEREVLDFFKGDSPELRAALGNRKGFELADPFPEILSVGPKVAGSLQQQALIAIFISIVAIIFYLSLRFEFIYGVAAIVALVHDVVVTIGVMAMTDMFFGDVFSLKINLTEVAAFLTIIGFSVNDTIVIFDRIRENLVLTKKRISFEDLVNAAVNQTLSRTVWTSMTVMVVTLSLLIFGGEPVKGFAFAFAIGLISGTYSTVFIASPVLIFMRRKAQERQARLRAEAQAAA